VRLVETYREKNGKEEKEEERKTKTLFLSLSTAPIAAMCATFLFVFLSRSFKEVKCG